MKWIGCYYNQLDKKYFRKSIYIQKFEKEFNVRIKDFPLQYEIIFETLNTIIKGNNILFSKNYIPKEQKVIRLLNLFNGYLTKYKTKINLAYDLNCIITYNFITEIVDELSTMKNDFETRKIKYNLIHIEQQICHRIFLYAILRINSLRDNRGMYYSITNDKLPRMISSKIKNEINDLNNDVWYLSDKQQQINDLFIDEYLQKTGIDLKENIVLRKAIFDIYCLIQDINNIIQTLIVCYDDKKFELYKKFIKDILNNEDFKIITDIHYIHILNKIENIYKNIEANNFKMAYNQIQEIINSQEHKKWFERTCD